jgi:hypothetical protein
LLPVLDAFLVFTLHHGRTLFGIPTKEQNLKEVRMGGDHWAWR